MEQVNALKGFLCAIGAALTALWGWFGWLVICWILCMVIDYATGTAAAVRAGKWSSKAARDGIWHKMGAVVVVIVAAILDMVIATIIQHVPAISLPFEYTVFFCPLVVVWCILTELGSIIENAGAMGAPVPGWLAKAIEALGGAVDAAAGTGSGDDGVKG